MGWWVLVTRFGLSGWWVWLLGFGFICQWDGLVCYALGLYLGLGLGLD